MTKETKHVQSLGKRVCIETKAGFRRMDRLTSGCQRHMSGCILHQRKSFSPSSIPTGESSFVVFFQCFLDFFFRSEFVYLFFACSNFRFVYFLYILLLVCVCRAGAVFICLLCKDVDYAWRHLRIYLHVCILVCLRLLVCPYPCVPVNFLLAAFHSLPILGLSRKLLSRSLLVWVFFSPHCFRLASFFSRFPTVSLKPLSHS